MNALISPALSLMTVPSDKLAAIRSRYLHAASELLQQFQNDQLQTPSDRRFSDPAWSSSPAHLLHAHFYLLAVDTLHEMVDAAQLDEPARERLHFVVMQWAEAVSPANYLLSNPQAQQKAMETHGQSLSKGMELFFADLQKGRLTQTDESAFQVGGNLATTPGVVVYENPLFQLIQYAPQSAQVYEQPLCIVPPNINKYYILDLQPHNSFVRYAVEQGFTVFLISWRNPLPGDTDNIQQATWGDYLQHGVLQALQVARRISGREQVNALGFCVGGTMLASALALASVQGDKPVAALTLLTSFLDFEEAGVLGVFVDEIHAQIRDQQLGGGGLMTANELATTFSFLRPGELVWNYVVNGYLLGTPPRAFDLLYWNSDGTNLSGPFFAWYFRNMYLENNLIQPGKVRIDGHPIDLSAVDMPAYIYASREDHIVPWQGAYASVGVLPNAQRFVLGASGHIAGVINPPARNRRSYWAYGTGTPLDATLPAKQWLTGAAEHAGSWWPDWAKWLVAHSGGKVSAPSRLGSDQYVPLEDAPGRYVHARAL